MTEKMFHVANQIHHFRCRAEERYGMFITQSDIDNINEMIQKNNSKIIRTRSLRNTIHEIIYNNTKMIVAYSKKTNHVATALPIAYDIKNNIIIRDDSVVYAKNNHLLIGNVEKINKYLIIGKAIIEPIIDRQFDVIVLK